MEEVNITLGIIISIVSSVIGATIYSMITERRQKKIKEKIEELDYEEKFLDKISKGNVELLRSSFKILFLCLGLFGISAGLILLSITLKLPQIVKFNILILSSVVVFVVGLSAFSHSRSLMKLNDLPKAKKKIDEQREQLKNKLK